MDPDPGGPKTCGSGGSGFGDPDLEHWQKASKYKKIKISNICGTKPHLHLLTKIHCSSNVIVDSNLHWHREAGLAARGKNQKSRKCLRKKEMFYKTVLTKSVLCVRHVVKNWSNKQSLLPQKSPKIVLEPYLLWKVLKFFTTLLINGSLQFRDCIQIDPVLHTNQKKGLKCGIRIWIWKNLFGPTILDIVFVILR